MKQNKLKVAFAASEAVPFAKTGGLADVAGTLPVFLGELGCEVKLFIPKYSSIDETKYGLNYCWELGELPIRVAGNVYSVHVHKSSLPDSNVEVYFIDCPHYFFRGSIYTNDSDEDERFILFSKSVIETLQRLQWAPDILHCNDWQTGLLPLLLKDNYGWDKMFNETKTVFTIHNIGYQGVFPKTVMFSAELNGDYFYPGGPVEFYDKVSFMKAAIVFSDVINTVSEKYAEEILTAEYGNGMEKSLLDRKEDLYGILNGVDYDVWNPVSDRLIPFRYNAGYLNGKLKNKKFLLEHFNRDYKENLPLIGIISRLVKQKGFDLVAQEIDNLMQLKANWIILGSGEDSYENLFKDVALTYPGKTAIYIGYNNELAHLIEAAADIFLMPSHYEPCGLNQIYSLKYGSVPVVRKTGGLADTVQDWHELIIKKDESGTGFSFNDYSGTALLTTLQRSIDTFKNKTVWKKIQKNGMNKDYSWKTSAEKYISLYGIALKGKNKF